MSCVICADDRATTYSLEIQMGTGVDCPVCGKYEVSHPVELTLKNQRESGALDQKALSDISVAIRQQQPSVVMVTWDTWPELLKSIPLFATPSKLNRLLGAISRRWPGLGQDIQFERPVFRELRTEVAARSSDELTFLMEALESHGWLRSNGEGPAGSFWGEITLAGWAALDPVGGGIPGRCFVAMSFADEMDDSYLTGIRRGIEDTGMDPRRLKEIEHTEKICDRILAEIRAAACVVADMTHFRPNVLFEAGYAMALGKPVVFTCQAEHFEQATSHFDTRQYPHMKWDNAIDVRRKLADRLRALGVALKPE